MSDVLRLTGIEKSYLKGTSNELRILDGLNLAIPEGELVGLIAPSGAGKSTLLHIAGLLDAADAGEIEIGGAAQTGTSDRARTRTRRQDIGFVYQFHHLLPEFTAAENIVLPQMANGVGRGAATDRALSLLGEVGLGSRAAHRPAELSGGEQQRVAFCRALANRPKLLLADEPTGNLDPGTADQVLETLLSLVRGTGLAALVATHNHALAERMDRVLKLEAGRLVGV